MSEWQRVKLGDVCEFYNNKRIPLSSMQRATRKGKYPYYGASGIVDYVDDYIFNGKYLLISEDGENLKTRKTEIAFYADGKFWVNNHSHIVRTNQKMELAFLYYYFKILNINPYITGAVQPKLNKANLESILIACPTLDEQKRIAQILSSLDDKIENNNAINKNLEEQAQAIFKSWFVDFEPFGRIMPSDWREGTLGDVADIVMGQSPSGSSYNEEKNGTVFYQGRAEFGWRFPTQRLFTTEPKRLAQKNDILMSVRAPVGDINIAYEDCCIGRGLSGLRSKRGCQSYLLYLMKSLHEVFQMHNGTGTVFGSINKDSLHSIKVTIPNDDYINKFEEIVSAFDKQILCNTEEIRNLSQLRDTLLPKLMSGELRV